MAPGLDLVACQHDTSAVPIQVADMAHEMMEARDERQLLDLKRQLSRLKLLTVNELGFVPLSRTRADLLFDAFSQRCERGSILGTITFPFNQ